MSDRKKIAVIDGNSWLHRAYHAVPPVMSLPDGTPTNAVHGFLNMFMSFYNKAKPDAIVCAFDAGIPQFRLDAVKQYKAQRKPMDNELRVQFPIIEEVLNSMDIPVVKVEGWEGDDILGTIAAMAEKCDMETLLVTGDKDANQLASNLTRIVNMKKGVSDVAILGPDEVYEKYGVRVDQFIDYLALMGDSSDNIPGVPGIGPKSASKLLQDFDSLDGIYQNLDKLKGKQLENIRDNKEAAYISQTAATISVDVPIDLDLHQICFPSYDVDTLTATFLKYRLKSGLAGVLALSGEEMQEEAGAEAGVSADGAAGAVAGAEAGVVAYDASGASGAGVGAAGAVAGGAVAGGVGAAGASVGTASSATGPLDPDTLTVGHVDINFEDYLTGQEAHQFIDRICAASADDTTWNIGLCIGHDLYKEQVQYTIFDIDKMSDGSDNSYENISSTDDSIAKLMLAVSDNKTTAVLEGQEAHDALVNIVKHSRKKEIVVENSKDVLCQLMPANNVISSSLNVDEMKNANLFDISLAAYILNSSKSSYSATEIYQQVCGEMLPTLDASVVGDKKDNGGANAQDGSAKGGANAQDGSANGGANAQDGDTNGGANAQDGSANDEESYAEKKNANTRLRMARRAAICSALKPHVEKLLQDTNGADTFNIIEKPLTSVLVRMEKNGAKINMKRMAELSTTTEKTLAQLKDEILEMAGEEFNIDSPKQLAHILFDVLGLPAKKKTKTGYSTNAAVLQDLALIHELPAKILEYREQSKIRSTYIVALPALVQSDGLIHTTFHQRKTTTGRLSSSDPNIQNIPTRTSFGNLIRECFLPLQEGHVFLSADYSQIELRLLAHLSQDQGLIDAFNSGADFHAATAASVFDVPVSNVSKQQRGAAKAVNFGIIYGQQAFGLSQTLKISVGEAKEIIDKYFATYPQVRAYLDEVVENAKRDGFAETIFGRRRYIPELNMGKRFAAFGQRTAMNHPMQGSAADIIKLAMTKLQDELDNTDIDAKCMMQVHDELDFSVAKCDVERLGALAKKCMENVVELRVPLLVDVEVGDNWAQAK